jgi:hypothetical protein
VLLEAVDLVLRSLAQADIIATVICVGGDGLPVVEFDQALEVHVFGGRESLIQAAPVVEAVARQSGIDMLPLPAREDLGVDDESQLLGYHYTWDFDTGVLAIREGETDSGTA